MSKHCSDNERVKRDYAFYLEAPEFRREVQHPSTLSLLDFSFPRSRLRISKCSGRRRKGNENPIFPW